VLLSKGSTVTEGIKHIFLDHGIEKVQVHRDDVANVVGAPAEKSPIAQFDGELRQKLNEFIEAGPFRAEDSGPPLRESMVTHNREAYNPEQRERLSSRHRRATKALDSVMRAAVRGGAVNGREVGQLTAASLESMTEDCESTITIASGADDKGVPEQSLQTAALGMAIGIEMGLDAESVRTIGTTGLVADWGMMHLPEDIRGAKRQLNEGQLFEIQQVPIFTAEMLHRTSDLPKLILPVAYQIHERIDGTGYPTGRDASSIHPFAKILHVADLYTALTAPGPNRRPMMPYAAMKTILREASRKSVDVDVTRSLLQVLSLFPIGSYVALSNRSVARVLRRNAEDYSSPIVQIVADRNGNMVDPDDEDAIMIPAEGGLEITQALPAPGRNELSSQQLLEIPA